MKRIFEFLRAIDPLVHLGFLVAIIILGYGYLSLNGRIDGISGAIDSLKSQVSSIQFLPSAGILENKEAPTSPTTPTPTATPSSQVAVSTKKSTTYLNLGSLFSTTSSDWVAVNGSDVYIDLEKEYGKNAYVDWEANIRISDTAGSVKVRLYDVTHSIGVNGSELSTSSITSTRVSSPRLYLWAGHNLYRAQIKSTAPYVATFDGGRVKIVY